MKSQYLAASLALGLIAAACHKGGDAKKDDPSTTPSAEPKAAPSAAADEPKKTDNRPAPGTHRFSRTTAVAFGMKPPKPEKMEAPHVPELPELAKQDKPPPPMKIATTTYPCGASHSGDEDYPLMCLEDKDHENSERVAKVLVPYGHIRSDKAPLPKVVDHREERTEGDIRNQGSAGTCTTFGTAAAIDHSVTRWVGTSSHVSTMQLWARYHMTDLGDALIASVGETFAGEDAWPYDAKTAWSWRDCSKSGAKTTEPCGKPVDKVRLEVLEKKPEVMVEQVEWLPKNFELMRQKIAGGQDPVFAMRLPRHFKPVGKRGEQYIADYKDEAGGHAMAIAGYAMGEKGDNYYLLHNSWGPKWGDGGYAWIHEQTLVKHMMRGFGIVDARPVHGEKAHRAGKTCPAGQAPDSLTAACMAECADGGPTHNGVCPDPSDCGAGYVNLFGECIGAAPTAASKDEKSGISWKCGPGGCAYTLPKSVGKCSTEPCVLSCPAPSFRAAKDEKGLTCVE